jgi:hypothetical protein
MSDAPSSESIEGDPVKVKSPTPTKSLIQNAFLKKKQEKSVFIWVLFGFI